MKYKVGDKFRMVNGGIAKVEGARYDVYKVIDDGGVNYVTSAYISHLVISEITDELIDRFKKEKIAWHFDDKYSYHKALQILEKEGITFNEKNECKEYFDIYEKFGIAYHGGFGFGDLEYFKSKGYEIIEIMNPVYVNTLTVTFQPLEFTYARTYKGIDCEAMFQQYMQQKKIPDLEKKVENQRKEIVRLNQRIEQYQEQMKILLEDRSLYKNRLDVIKELCEEDL